MSSLRDLRQRRQSIESSKKLTSAMKMVASAKFTAFQRQWSQAKKQRSFLEGALSLLAQEVDLEQWPAFCQPRKYSLSQKTLIILIGADRGLCGGFNTQLARFLTSQGFASQEVLAMGCGNRAVEFLEKTGVTLVDKVPMGLRPTFGQAQALVKKALALLEERQVGRCVLIYTHFIHAMRQEPVIYPLLPFVAPFEKKETPSALWPLLEPTGPVLCDALAKMALESFVYEALVESCLSEQGARMTAMENATRNSEEVLKNLNLLYNRKRQSLITNELLEVISGANV